MIDFFFLFSKFFGVTDGNNDEQSEALEWSKLLTWGKHDRNPLFSIFCK